MARAIFVKKARKDIPDAGIKAGESYYWWKFRYGGKHVSRTPPKASQLTQSSFKSTLYELQEREQPKDVEDMEGFRDEIVSDLENLRDECQGSLDAMPEGLQQGDTGQMLQTRIDSIEEALSNLESVDVECDAGKENREGEETEDEYKARWLEETFQEISDALGNIDEG